MSVHFASPTAYLSRASSITDWNGIGGPSAGISWQLWFKLDAMPTGTQYVPIWLFGDPSLVHPYIRTYITSAGIITEIWDGISIKKNTPQPITPPTRWVSLMISYHKVNQNITMHRIHNTQSVTISNVIMETIPFVENFEYLGGDLSNGTKLSGVSFGYTYISPGMSSGAVALGINSSTSGMDKTALIQMTRTPNELFAVNGLEDSSDLVDFSTNGHDWVSHGTITTGPSPFGLPETGQADFRTLMPSTGFSENFNDGTIKDWTLVNNGSNVKGYGTDGSCAYACGSQDMYIERVFEAPYLTAGTLNFNLSMRWNNPVVNDSWTWMFFSYEPIRNAWSDLIGSRLQVYASMNWNGSVLLQLVTGGSPNIVSFTTPPSTIPLDGTPVGVQWTWQLVGGNLIADFYVNTVKQGTVAASGVAPTFPYSNRLRYSPVGTANLWSATDDFKFLNTYNGLTPPSAPTNMPKLPSGAVCQNIVPFVAGMTIDCASKDLLVTGYGFNTSTVWNVQGPNAIAVPVTNVSILDGAARLHITDWPGSGKYCITATNPPPGNCNGLVYF